MSHFSVDRLVVLRDDEAADWVVRLCQSVRESLGARRVSVGIYNPAAQTISPFASDDPQNADHRRLTRKWLNVRLSDAPAAEAALVGAERVVIADAPNDDRLPAGFVRDFGLKSIVYEPLVVENEPVGILAIEPAAAVEGQEELLQSMVPVLAASVGRVLTWRESDRRRAEAEFLLDLTEAAISERSLSELLAAVCERVARHMRVRRASVFLEQNGRIVPRMSRFADGSRDSAAWSKFRSSAAPLPAVDLVMREGQPVVAEDPHSPMIEGWWADSFNIASAIAVPVGKPSNLIGVLTLDAATPRRFSKDEVRIASAVGAHVATIIERAQAAEERSAHLRAATSIRRLLEEGSRTVSVEQAAEVLARVTRDALGAEHATVVLADEAGEQVDNVTTVGVPARFDSILREQLLGSPGDSWRIWRLTSRQPKPIFVENARISRLLPSEMVDMLQIRSFVALPLLSSDHALGLVVCTHSQGPRRWTAEERKLVAQLALEGSLVLENASLRAAERLRMDELAHQAFHDPLTRLPNRVLFSDRLEHALARTQRREESVAVLFLDLDIFKNINDSLGHDAGDQLLVAVAGRLQSCLRPGDTIARLGGDEFTVLLEDVVDIEEATRVADRIAETLRTPFLLEGQDVTVTSSVGIALSAPGQTLPEELLRNADAAMYSAKRRGKNRYELFSPDSYDPMLGLLELDGRSLRSAGPAIGARDSESSKQLNGRSR
jgi:diguanylate cyclase (GGDEF)-like protein